METFGWPAYKMEGVGQVMRPTLPCERGVLVKDYSSNP